MSKGIGGIKGYHSGGGVTHTHGSKKNKEKKNLQGVNSSNRNVIPCSRVLQG